MINDFEVTLLSIDDIKKSCWKSIFPDFSVNPTDFAKILGANYNGVNCSYWLKNDIKELQNELTPIVNEHGEITKQYAIDESIAIVPAIKFSTIKSQAKYYSSLSSECHVYYMGEYPNYFIGNDQLRIKLEKLYKEDKLTKTGKVYTTDATYAGLLNSYVKRDNFVPFHHIEYEYKDKKYVRVKGYNHIYNSNPYQLVASVFDKNNDVYWVEVTPIKWLVDTKNDIAFTENALIAGIKYHYNSFNGKETKKENISFKDTAMYIFLNKYFKNDLMSLNYIFNDNILDNTDYENNMYNETISKKFK